MLEKDMAAAVRLKFQNILACLSSKLTKFSKISLLLKSSRSWHILEAEKGNNKGKSVAKMLRNPGKSQPGENPVIVDIMKNSHTPILSPNQCGSSLVQTINAPLPIVWSMIRQFDNPQAYKLFVKDCNMLVSNGGIGSVREVMVVSGLPAETSLERLDRLDDDSNVMMVSIIGGDHKLVNYRSTTTLHETKEEDGCKTVVIESYVVDIPGDSCGEDTCLFANTIISCNLKSLAMVTEKMALKSLAMVTEKMASDQL